VLLDLTMPMPTMSAAKPEKAAWRHAHRTAQHRRGRAARAGRDRGLAGAFYRPWRGGAMPAGPAAARLTWLRHPCWASPMQLIPACVPRRLGPMTDT
jgi:hypothetical protein